LSFHGVLGQFPYTCTLVTLTSSVGERHEVLFGDYRFEYSKIKKDLFWGFQKHDEYYLATPEKALLDCIYYDNRIPFHDELEYELLDEKQLLKLAAKFPRRVLEKAGKFLEMYF